MIHLLMIQSEIGERKKYCRLMPSETLFKGSLALPTKTEGRPLPLTIQVRILIYLSSFN